MQSVSVEMNETWKFALYNIDPPETDFICNLHVLLLRLPEMCLQLYLDPEYSALGMKREVPAVSGECNIYVGAGAIPPETNFISIC